MLFLSTTVFQVRSATSSFMSRTSRRSSFTSGVEAARSVSPLSLRLPASRNSFDQNSTSFGQALASAKLSDTVLPAKPLQHDPDLLFSSVVLACCAADVFDNLLRSRSLWSGFLSHLRSPLDYDEPEILQSSSHAFCPMSAEPGHRSPSLFFDKLAEGIVYFKARPNWLVDQVKPRIIPIENRAERNVCNFPDINLISKNSARVAPDAQPLSGNSSPAFAISGRFAVDVFYS